MNQQLQPGARLGPLAETLDERLTALERDDVVRRIWARDHTVWKPEPTEISNRLGWLDLPVTMAAHTAELKEFAATCADFERVVLLGMGGSSLAPEVLSLTFGGKPLVVLDTTHPEAVAAVAATGDLRRSLFIVASKSGTTVETLSHFAYFYDQVGNGDQFVAITDPGTPLKALAADKQFRRVFINPADLGGRYSALSYFGLVPAALIGVDIDALLASAAAMARACAVADPIAENPGAWLGALLGAAASVGRDKLTLQFPAAAAGLGAWIEQLIAESTGKEGTGIVPVDGEPLGAAAVYGADRLFVSLGDGRAPVPAVDLPFGGREALGGEFFRWEFATAIAGHLLSIHPFDQPNVEEAKDATRRLLDTAAPPSAANDDIGAFLEALRPGEYLAIQAYLPRTAANSARLEAARLRLRDRFKVATTLGFGPRLLHSTGQLHKGGPASGVFVQVVDAPATDLAIPGSPFSFGKLLAGQAAGDREALRARGRRVARVGLADLEAAG